jgi:hypothetical protein
MASLPSIAVDIVGVVAALIGTLTVLNRNVKRYRIACGAFVVMFLVSAWVDIHSGYSAFWAALSIAGAVLHVGLAIRYWNNNPYSKNLDRNAPDHTRSG